MAIEQCRSGFAVSYTGGECDVDATVGGIARDCMIFAVTSGDVVCEFANGLQFALAVTAGSYADRVRPSKIIEAGTTATIQLHVDGRY